MRVLFLIESGGPGGAERVVLSLAQELKLLGVSVIVVTLREGWFTHQLHEHKIEHHLLKSSHGCDLTLPWRISRLAKSLNATLIHSHLLDSNFYGAIAAKFAGIPHLATEHGDIHHIDRRKFLGLKIQTLKWLGSHVAAVSRFARTGLIDKGIPSARLHVLPNPVRVIASDPIIRKKRRQQLGIEEEVEKHWVWITVANLRPVKNQSMLLQAFSRALKLSPRAQSLVVIGDGVERSRLELLTNQLGIRDQVHFLGFRDDIPEWLSAADGFALTSLSESLPVSLLEAGSAGKLVVATDVGGVSEVITNEETGYLVPSQDTERMSQAMASTVRNLKQSLSIGENLQKKVLAQYSGSFAASEYLKIYKYICSIDS